MQNSWHATKVPLTPKLKDITIKLNSLETDNHEIISVHFVQTALGAGEFVILSKKWDKVPTEVPTK